ncbi:MAG: hypothetical protein KTR16_09430 [Acidiferrobacterales bacterium]|nr:hypothetical protein [Acidiferrobacterales bacterium]
MIHKLTLGILFLITSSSAFAHHNWSAIYNVDGDVEIQGEISKIVWRNPHVVFHFTENAGTPEERIWTTHSNSVSALARMNVDKEMVAVGTKVRVAGYPNRSKEYDFFMNHLLLEAEGREIVFLRTADPRWPEEAVRVGDTNYAHGLNPQEDISERPTSVFAAWSTIFGAEGSHRALSGPGPDFRINYAEPRGTGDCASKEVWDEMGSPYPIALFDHREKDGTVIVHAEQNDTIRPVYMDVEHNDDGSVKNNLGYSTGRFVGDTLVVFTTFEGSNSPIQMHETFTLSGDRNHLNYTQTLINPESDDLPHMGSRWWEFQPGSYVQPYDCVTAEEIEAL